MLLKSLATVLAAGTLVAIGCDESNTATTPAETTATPSAGATGDNARSAATDLKMQAQGAEARVRDSMDGASTRAADAGNATVTQAQGLYDQARTAISNAKWDDAQKYVDQLKGLRDKLPAEWQVRVDELGAMLTNAKSKMGNLQMPAMPK